MLWNFARQLIAISSILGILWVLNMVSRFILDLKCYYWTNVLPADSILNSSIVWQHCVTVLCDSIVWQCPRFIQHVFRKAVCISQLKRVFASIHDNFDPFILFLFNPHPHPPQLFARLEREHLYYRLTVPGTRLWRHRTLSRMLLGPSLTLTGRWYYTCTLSALYS